MSQVFNKDILSWETFPNYDLLYTDPPWGERMVKWFATAQFKATGIRPTHTLNDVFNALAQKASITKPCFIEYEVKGWEYVVDRMTAKGHTFNNRFERMQSMGRPFSVLAFNSNLQIPAGLRGFEIVTHVVKELNAKIVFDPFAGVGLTAKATHLAGAEYIGAEINGERFSKLKAVIKQHEGLSK